MRRRDECFTTLQSGHLLCNSKTNNGQVGVGFLINRKWEDRTLRVNSISPRVAELILCITKRYKLRMVQVHASQHHRRRLKYRQTLGKPSDGRFQGAIGKRTNPIETATGILGLELRKERGDTDNITKVQNHAYHVSEESREEMDMEKPKCCNEDRN